jgi:hypothetical protein
MSHILAMEQAYYDEKDILERNSLYVKNLQEYLTEIQPTHESQYKEERLTYKKCFCSYSEKEGYCNFREFTSKTVIVLKKAMNEISIISRLHENAISSGVLGFSLLVGKERSTYVLVTKTYGKCFRDCVNSEESEKIKLIRMLFITL